MYVLHVRTGQEANVRKQLLKKGYTAYVPMELRRIRQKGEWKEKPYLLFPSYVFVDIDLDDEVYYKIKSAIGVIRFLGNESPCPLHKSEEPYIKLCCNNGRPIKPSKVRVLQDGSTEIVDGVLMMLQGNIKIDKHSQKAIAQLNICGSTKNVKLSVDIIQDQRKDAADSTRLIRPDRKKPLT